MPHHRSRPPLPHGVLAPGLLVLGLPVLSLLSACSDEPPLVVAGVSFDAGELGSFSQEQVELLGAMAVLAHGASGGAWEEIGSLRLDQDRRIRLQERLREEVILEGAGVSEADLESLYAGAPELELVVRHFVVLSERWEAAPARAAARERAAAGLARLRGGEPFESVVADVSEEPGAAARGGLLRPGRRGTWVEEFWTAATRLDEGEVSPVVESPFGFHVLRLEERRTLPFAEARPSVVRRAAEGLGGGEHWEEMREGWMVRVEVTAPGVAPRPGVPTVLDLAAGVPEVLPDSQAVLARWPGGTLDAASFRRHLLALPARTLRRVGADAEAMEAEVRRAAEVHYLAQVARERGLEPTEADEAEQLRRWQTEAGEWAALLGFRGGMSAEERREAARSAMRLTGQNARIARDGVAEAAPTLLGSVPVVIHAAPWARP